MGVLVYAFAIAVGGILIFWGRRLASYIVRRRRLVQVVEALPGPPAVPILGNTHQFHLNRVAFSYQLEELSFLHAKGGAFRLWIGPNPIILLTTGITAEPVLTSGELITKANLGYYYLRQWLGDGLLLSTGQKWKRRRKMLTPTFHYGILQGFVDIQAEQAGVLASKLGPMADAGLPFDIFPFVGRCALDIICESAMGVGVNAQEERESAYVKAVLRMTEDIFKRFHFDLTHFLLLSDVYYRERMPWLWLKPIWYALGYGTVWDTNLELLSGFTKKVIADRKAALVKEATAAGVPLKQLKPADKRRAFLDLLLLIQAETRELSDSDIAEEVDVFMFEGHDTTSSGMGWTLFCLGHYPDIQTRVAEELEDIFGTSDRAATTEDLSRMHYLERVIKESLRLFPPVPLFARNVTEDFKAGDYLVPAGSTAVVLPFLLHRDPAEFGADAEEFDPDRFLPERCVGRHPYAYVPFSAGPRNCIGQKFALMEEKAVISRVIREFRVTSLEELASVRPIPDIILRPAEKFLVRLERRKEFGQ